MAEHSQGIENNSWGDVVLARKKATVDKVIENLRKKTLINSTCHKDSDMREPVFYVTGRHPRLAVINVASGISRVPAVARAGSGKVNTDVWTTEVVKLSEVNWKSGAPFVFTFPDNETNQDTIRQNGRCDTLRFFPKRRETRERGLLSGPIYRLGYFPFQPVLHNWFNKGRGMCSPVYGKVRIKDPLLLIGKSNLCGGSGFPLKRCQNEHMNDVQ